MWEGRAKIRVFWKWNLPLVLIVSKSYVRARFICYCLFLDCGLEEGRGRGHKGTSLAKCFQVRSPRTTTSVRNIFEKGKLTKCNADHLDFACLLPSQHSYSRLTAFVSFLQKRFLKPPYLKLPLQTYKNR